MRYKVVVTKVDVAERWVRATDEEHAAQKVKDELTTPWSYAGRWDTKAIEVQVVESEQDARFQQEPIPESGQRLFSLKEAASELGISYGTLHSLMKRGDIEFTQVASRKFISRESLAAFIRSNTHPGSVGT